MPSPDDAVALVRASPLLDEQWYAAQVGRAFGSREEAARHWVAGWADRRAGATDASPHPLFEPVWLYPRAGWRRHAPDPLSHYLATTPRPARSPHPRYPRAELGPLEDWLAAGHDPAELLPAPVPREHADLVVRLRTREVAELVRWVRHLAREHRPVAIDLTDLDGAAARVLAAVAADLPGVHVGPVAPPRGEAEVVVEAGVRPPAWRWLEALHAAHDHHGRPAQPVLVDDDTLLTAPALAGHPVSSLDALDGVALPAPFAGVVLRRVGDERPPVLTTQAWLPGPPAAVPGLPPTPVADPPPGALRWAIDIAAPAAPLGRRWGDWHFARSLARALERLGQVVEVDHPETRGRATRDATDVVLVLRGLERVEPPPGPASLLWVISHPDEVSAAELAAHDRVFAASTTWAAAHGVEPLLQCTDATTFHPGLGTASTTGPALFVGHARGGPRPVVTAALEAGVPLEVIGSGWAEHGVQAAAEGIANHELGARYASAGVVLNDHHPAMREAGFVSNRVLDVLAVGGRLLTDPVPGLEEAVGADVPTWRDAADVARLAVPPYAAWPGPEERRALAERVVAEHSFDARAAVLLAAARDLVARS
ncbi:glycosyltransferase [Nocardioides litoris]|uniref:glycosyltransferase n=1 Tax=Nocardioides litoris TaxID=1926648 RepID=UPI0014773002|nr:glycosyltransferase [Nocardioides litoris]